jgi:hypothetical protein
MSQASVVIASRRPALITKAIAPLLDDPATLEVIVVSVASPEVTDAVQAIGDPRIQVVLAPAGNPNTSRQVGVEHARGDTVVMLDDDVLASPGLVSGHARHHPTPGLAVFGYMPVPRDRLRGALHFPARIYAKTYEDRVRWWADRPDLAMTGFWGGNVSMTRADVLRVGLDNPSFPVRYYEDHDFGERCQAAGIVGRFDRRIEARHLYERSISEWLVEGRRAGAALAVRYPGSRPSSSHLPVPMRRPVLGAAIVASLLRLRRAESRLAWAVRQIEIFRGAREVSDGTAVESGLIVGLPGRRLGEVRRPVPSERGAHDTGPAGGTGPLALTYAEAPSLPAGLTPPAAPAPTEPPGGARGDLGGGTARR